MVKRDVFDEEFVFNVDRSASGSLIEKTDASGTIMSLASPLELLPALLLSTFLLQYQLVYQRSEAAVERLQALADRLRALQQPEARPTMLKKAQDFFQGTGYPYYLLRQQSANGHRLASLQHAQQILSTVFHCLALCNQACIDTRKLEQVLALPKLPLKFADTVARLTQTYEPDELLAASEQLLNTTRDLLFTEQRQSPGDKPTFAAAFGAGYPELKGDIQHILLACERQDPFVLRGPSSRCITSWRLRWRGFIWVLSTRVLTAWPNTSRTW
ncbi:MAG: hypothetical protein DCC55_07785 [Chloroflexi bacterium]|nr:MAG: hypothetical protein DCC55_07785 [Chloroflexota bacterium]